MRIGVYQTPLAADLPLPQKAHPTDVGWDIPTAVDFVAEPGVPVKVPTGLVIEMPDKIFTTGYLWRRKKWVLSYVVKNRTGLGSRGLIAVATEIDSGYRPAKGDNNGLTLCLCNVSREPITCKRGDRVAQIVPVWVNASPWVSIPESQVTWRTLRGAKRFGETGR